MLFNLLLTIIKISISVKEVMPIFDTTESTAFPPLPARIELLTANDASIKSVVDSTHLGDVVSDFIIALKFMIISNITNFIMHA